jgi:hypothetical protein
MHRIKLFFCLSLVAGLTALGLCSLSAIAQEADPHAVSLYNLGLTAFKEGSPESAVIFFKRATDIDPNLADAHYNLGVIYQSQKRYKEAIPRFEEVLRIKSGDADAHYQLAVMLQDAGRYSEAKEHLSQIPPSSNHFQDAQARLNQLNNLPPGSVAPNQVGQASYGQPQFAPPQLNQSPIASQPINQAPNDQMASSMSLQSATVPQAPYGMQPTVPATSLTNPGQGLEQMASNVPNQVEKPAEVSAAPNPVPVLPNSTLRVIANGFNAPSGLAFDRLGNLYVANYISDTIDRIGADGTRSQFAVGANLKGPIGLVADEAGNLYVANYNGGTVARISPAGISTVIATGFRKPYYLTLDVDGNLYVSQQEDNTVVRITLPKPLGAKAR